jgi:hypothetical protein
MPNDAYSQWIIFLMLLEMTIANRIVYFAQKFDRAIKIENPNIFMKEWVRLSFVRARTTVFQKSLTS